MVRSSEIEGEKLDSDQVRSSIARRLGMDIGGLVPADRDVEGVVEMMLDATQKYARAAHGRAAIRLARGAVSDRSQRHAQDHRRRIGGTTAPARCRWSRGRSAESGSTTKRRPPAGSTAEMRDSSIGSTAPATIDPVLMAALAHLWFVTIHPFDDGNGRIARAIADMALARSEQSPQRFYSMSAQIRLERNAYYDMLERTQKGDLDITAVACEWFLGASTARSTARRHSGGRAAQGAFLGDATRTRHSTTRQRKMLNRLLDGFEGKLTTSKWAKLTKCSQDTAYRDILDLVERGDPGARTPAGGRSTSYSLIVGVERK